MSGIQTFWRQEPILDSVLVGVLRGETRPGFYRFEGVGASGTYAVDDAQLLTPDADLGGSGEHRRPRIPSHCVAIVGPGGSIWVIGFSRPARFDENADDPPDAAGVNDNQADGDKAYASEGGAKLLLKAGGAVVLESGGLASMTLNPIHNQISVVSSELAAAADGYNASRGRVNPGSTDPETRHVEDFWDTLGPSYDRVRLRHGELGGDVVRELTVTAVTEVGTERQGKIYLRETYKSDGSWHGEGQRYLWGAGDEAHVLGNQLSAFLKDLIAILRELKVGTALGPSSPPLPDVVAKLQQLEQQLSGGKILSDFLFLSKNPADPGTTDS